MRRLSLIIIVLFGCFRLGANTRHAIDSLEARLTQPLEGTDRTHTLNLLSFHYRNIDLSAAQQYADEALKLAQQLGLSDELGNAWNHQAILAQKKGMSAQAFVYYQKALNSFENPNDEAALSVYWNLGNLFIQHELGQKARYYFALSQAGKANKKPEGLYWLSVGSAFFMEDQLDSATYYLHRAYHWANQVDNEAIAFSASNNLVSLYLNSKNLDSARFYLRKTLTFEQFLKQPNQRIYVSANQIALGFEEGRLDSLSHWIDSTVALIRQTGYMESLPQILEFKARYQVAVGSAQKAYQTQRRASAMLDSLLGPRRQQALMDVAQSYELDLAKEELMGIKLKSSREKWLLLLILALVLAVLVLAILFLRGYYKLNNALRFKNERLHQENTLVKYEVLKAQINPHFLFNNLNALHGLIAQSPEQAQQFTSAFSDVFRQVLSSTEESVIKLSEELKVLEAYFSMLHIRFGSMLKKEINLPAAMLQGYLPPCSLQLLVENAIKHNIIAEKQPLLIEIYAQGEMLYVRNTLQPRKGQTHSTGTGLKNLALRYEALSDQQLRFYTENGYYYAIIPIIKPEML